MIIRQTTILRLVALANFFALTMFQGAFSATGGNDADTVARIAAEGAEKVGSFGMTALVYAIFPNSLIQIVVLLVGGLFILFCTRRLQSNTHGLVLIFLTLAPSMLTVATFQKDLLLVPFVIAAALCIQHFRKSTSVVVSIMVIYGLYGVLFRDYYFLIIFFFAFILAFRKFNLQWRLILLLSLALIMMMTPTSVFETLQGPRDFVNYHRLRDPNFIGARTAFANLMPIEGAGSFTLNYIYALIRLNLAAFLTPGPRELFLGLNVYFYFFAIVTAFRHGNHVSRNAASLLLAHLIVLTFFEPDLGSYIRHLSTTLPFAAIPLIEFFSRRKLHLVFRKGTSEFNAPACEQRHLRGSS